MTYSDKRTSDCPEKNEQIGGVNDPLTRRLKIETTLGSAAERIDYLDFVCLNTEVRVGFSIVAVETARARVFLLVCMEVVNEGS